jgi:hypothetical protein
MKFEVEPRHFVLHFIRRGRGHCANPRQKKILLGGNRRHRIVHNISFLPRPVNLAGRRPAAFSGYSREVLLIR